jgi:hypothetical protein
VPLGVSADAPASTVPAVKAIEAGAKLVEVIEAGGVRLRVAEDRSMWIGDGADARAAWDAFKALAPTAVYEPFVDDYGETCHLEQTGDGDLLRFETSVASPWVGSYRPEEIAPDGALAASFTRQFSFLDANGEYLHMNRLGLDVEVWDPPDAVAVPDVQIWGCGGPPWTQREWELHGEDDGPFDAAIEWVAEVEDSAVFKTIFGQLAATRFVISQGDI